MGKNGIRVDDWGIEWHGSNGAESRNAKMEKRKLKVENRSADPRRTARARKESGQAGCATNEKSGHLCKKQRSGHLGGPLSVKAAPGFKALQGRTVS